MVGLGDLPGGGFLSHAFDVSADGQTVVGSSRSAAGLEAFRWTAQGGMQPLGDLPGGPYWSEAQAVSADGAVIVGRSQITDSLIAPFIWDAAHGMRNLHTVLTQDFGLDLTGWALYQATGISADGRTIVGNGNSPRGLEAWIAHIPEPATLSLLALGFAFSRLVR